MIKWTLCLIDTILVFWLLVLDLANVASASLTSLMSQLKLACRRSSHGRSVFAAPTFFSRVHCSRRWLKTISNVDPRGSLSARCCICLFLDLVFNFAMANTQSYSKRSRLRTGTRKLKKMPRRKADATKLHDLKRTRTVVV
jgi:hypothetical protein